MLRHNFPLTFCLLALCCTPLGCTTYAPKPHNAASWALLSPEIHGTPGAPKTAVTSTPRTRSNSKAPPGPAISPKATSRPLAVAIRTPAPAAAALIDVVEPAPKQVQASSHKTPEQAYQACKKKGKISFARRAPKGALVFFHNTKDLNGDGRNNDWYTTTAQVLAPADRQGTLTLRVEDAAGASAKVKMNLDYPDIHTQSGTTYNTALRPKLAKDPPFTQHLAGELFAGFCAL